MELIAATSAVWLNELIDRAGATTGPVLRRGHIQKALLCMGDHWKDILLDQPLAATGAPASLLHPPQDEDDNTPLIIHRDSAAKQQCTQRRHHKRKRMDHEGEQLLLAHAPLRQQVQHELASNSDTVSNLKGGIVKDEDDYDDVCDDDDDDDD